MKNLRFKLLVSLTVFAVVLVTVVAFTNRGLLRKDIQTQAQNTWGLIENHILADMQTVDYAHYYLESELSKQLEAELQKMYDLYEENPNVLSWDLEAFKQNQNMEYYILDDENTVIHTTFTKDLGLNFNDCCKKFANLLDERRMSGEFFNDGIDISTQTGQLWKYSYLATPDKKYLMEIGVNATDILLFEKFNFFDTAINLVSKYDDLLEVKIINSGGFFLDDQWDVNDNIKEKSPEFQAAFKQARQTSKAVEYKIKLEDGYVETYRFIPYNSMQERGFSTKRVIFAKYGNGTELALLKKNTQQFWIILFVSVITSFILLVVISRLLTGTIKLATFDPLTGVNNRTSYLSYIEGLLKRKKNGYVGLLVLDLDNFKQVNDQYGHIKGDEILVEMANILMDTVKKEGFVVRFGGDEFAIVVENATVEKMKEISNEVIASVHHKKNSENVIWGFLTVSIGCAIQEEERETEVSLFMRADKALYKSKNSGKDRYSFFKCEEQLGKVSAVTIQQ
ncbi:GGDEF domain-containing protein [Solibacillus sp. CAU 1738]|uniref:GGDEF domain-containing protein n=1 Tax=Solibacillus sp. CAU 1738 TaxID=3140363 RepID=UPI0032608C0B